MEAETVQVYVGVIVIFSRIKAYASTQTGGSVFQMVLVCSHKVLNLWMMVLICYKLIR